jgi:hypothetical protein
METQDKRLDTAIHLAEKMKWLEQKILEINLELKRYEENHRQISAVELPELMAEIGLQSFSLSDGTKLSIAPVFKISIPKIKMDEAYEWLVEHHHDGMVKTRLLLPSGTSNYILHQIMIFVRNHINGNVETERTIHPSTLGAWGREMERENMVIPEDIFSIYRSNKTIIE